MDAVLNGTSKPVVSDKKRQPQHDEPPVLSRCIDSVGADGDRQAEPCSSPPSLRRESYVTRQRSLDLKASPKVFRFTLQRNERAGRNRYHGASSGFGKLALRLLKRKKRKQQRRKRLALLGPVISTEGRTTRSRTAASILATPSCENSTSSVDLEVTPGTSRILRPRKSEVSSPAPPAVETVKPPKPSPVQAPREVPAPAKGKCSPEEVDFVDGIEILGFSSLDDLQKYTEAEEALKGPTHLSDEEEIDVEYFSDFEEDPASSSAMVSNTLNSFSLSDSSRMSLFDSSDGEADGSSPQNDDWNLKDLVDEASCSSSKHVTSDQRPKSEEKPEMPKVGQVVDLGLGRSLRPETARNVHRLMDQSSTLSRKLAEFSVSVVAQRGKPVPKTRMVMPVVCSKLLEIMKYRWAVGDRGEQVTLTTAKTKADIPKPGTSTSGVSCPQLKTILQQPSTSRTPQETDLKGRFKRKSDKSKGGRPPKRTRKSKEPSATAVADDKNESDIEIIEVKKVSKVEEKEDVTKATDSPTEPTIVTKIERIPTEVADIVREMVDFVILRNQERPIPFDPDQSEGLACTDEEKSAPPAKAPTQKRMRSGLLCELRRLDVTVFDMDEEATEEPPAEEATAIDEDCKKDTCRLGCVCESLAGRRAAMPTHCGRVDCMFECSCTSISYERKPGGRHLLDVSDATLAWIQDESERNLAKVERQFKQTVVRAKDDLIVMGSKRSRREIKMPARYSEHFITNKDSYLMFEIERMKKKSLTTLTPPLTPTNKSLSPTKLITPPKAPGAKPTPPSRPKFDEPSEYSRPKAANILRRRTMSESSQYDSESEDETSPLIRPCSVLLYRISSDEPVQRLRNVAMKSTSKVRHTHNINQSSARTSCNFTEKHRVSKKKENKLSNLWSQHSADNEIFCHIVKEHSISPEEWEKSGELAASNEVMSPLKKNANSVQLIPWSFLQGKFRTGEYQIWYKRQQGNTRQKLYLTDGPTKPNKVCVNLRELEDPLSENLPPMIAKLLMNDTTDDNEKDARCFLKSLGDYWMIAGYMQRTAGAPSSTDMPDNKNMITRMVPSITKTSEEESVDIDDPQSRVTSTKNPVKAQARWWLLHLTQTFDMLLFRNLGVSVKYAQIKKTAALANKDQTGAFIRMCLQKNSKSKFGLYGVPGMPDCVLIGPYALDQPPGFTAYSQISSTKKHYVRVPIYCANKDSEYELESRKIATPDWLLRIPHRVIGTWLYDFKSLEAPRPGSVHDKHPERRVSGEIPEKSPSYFSAELKSRLEENSRTSPQPHPQLQPPKLPVVATTTASRPKVRPGQSLLKGSDEVKAINKNTLSVKIDGKAKEALVHVGEEHSPSRDESRRGILKIRQDLMRAPTPPLTSVPPSTSSPSTSVPPSTSLPPSTSAPPSTSVTPSTSSSPKLSTEKVVDIEEDEEMSEPPQDKNEPKRDFIVSNIKNLGYIPVTYVNDSSVFIPHFTVPGQVHFFQTHDEVVKYVYQAVRQKIAFIGLRPETISWRQVDSLDDVNEEKQFNPGVLVGNHVITHAGLINLVTLTEESIPSLNLLPNDAEVLAAKLDHKKSLPLLRTLGRMCVGPQPGPQKAKMSQNDIIFMAVSEIEKIVAQSTALKNQRKELLDEQHKIEEKLKGLIKGLPEDERLKSQKEINSILGEKPVIVLDVEAENEKAAPVVTSRNEFAVSEMVNLSSDDEEVAKTAPNVAEPPPLQTTVGKLPSSTIVTPEAITITTTTPVTNITPVTASRPSQSLICKFPFSPLKRVNVTVKEDGIVSTSSINKVFRINQQRMRTLTRAADGSLVKAIKIVDPNTLKHLPPVTRVLQAPPKPGQSIIKPNFDVVQPATPRKFPILRAMPRPGFAGKSYARPRTVLMARTGATVPMTVVHPKSGEPFVKLVSPNSDKVLIASSLPVVKSATDLRSAGLKVLHPNLPANQRLSSPPKANVIRILKPVPSTTTSDNSVKVLLSPKTRAVPRLIAAPPAVSVSLATTTAAATPAAAAPSAAAAAPAAPASPASPAPPAPPMPPSAPAPPASPATPAAGIAVIDTTELVID